ncbi:MAG: hypothetical protein ACLUN1_06755 [Odoribacter splanchnicus]|uniref:Uncharacterized protein n=1 Tax=Odoribacter splanchnicus TaxID=28118 RepID=A0AAW5C847_9BACT|nr:hypothetical protein [Odoribacter splanchnicus]MBS6594036.1 hypothetical protein [Odoribacter splanchnicus]MBT9662664.1 hypothetical protein [Odoribacter splanchnicus]MBV4401225.1 hypothetical protein [Odoribacter splanchnicus]MBV4409903.1 hypothetical protein [Odoribacter splanchnicus]MCG4960379.1 hypothetical protein [Odoribacter splanchnicus]
MCNKSSPSPRHGFGFPKRGEASIHIVLYGDGWILCGCWWRTGGGVRMEWR